MCSSVIVGEGAVVRDCIGIGRMGVMCKIGIIYISICDE
jgi:hypothetical protein